MNAITATAPTPLTQDTAPSDVAGPTPFSPQPARVEKVAKIQNAAEAALEIIIPDAVVFGETHNPPGFPGLAGGNFVLINAKTGQPSYFGAKPVKKLADIELKDGTKIPQGISIVGSANPDTDEAGGGYTATFPTPIGKILFFANIRQDGLTAGKLAEKIAGKEGDGKFTVSVNVGAAYSVSDGLTIASAGLNPAFAGGLRTVTEATGGNLWAGVGYRAQATFENGQLSSLKIGGVDVPIEKLGEFLANQVEAQRKSPTLPPNFGSNEIASINDTTLAIYGQSPWDIGASAATFGKGGAYDVKNHGNAVTAVTEPIYELGVREGVIAPGQRIKSNAEAGSIINTVLNRIAEREGAGSEAYGKAVERLSNPYDLTFGSLTLEALKPITFEQKPADYDFVRSVFEGEFRKDQIKQPSL